MNEFRILNINECVHYLPSVLRWYSTEWGDWSDGVGNSIINNIGDIELFVVVSPDDSLVGVAGFAVSDLPTRKDLSPWLVGVYVSPEFRNLGVASMLERHVVSHAKSQGVKKLWLFTEFARRLYEKNGWVFVEDVNYNNGIHALMYYEFVKN